MDFEDDLQRGYAALAKGGRAPRPRKRKTDAPPTTDMGDDEPDFQGGGGSGPPLYETYTTYATYGGGGGDAEPDPDQYDGGGDNTAAGDKRARRAAAKRAKRTIAPPTLADIQAPPRERGAVSATRALLAEGYVAWAPPKSDPHAFVVASVEGGARARRFVWAGGGKNPRAMGAGDHQEAETAAAAATGAGSDGTTHVHDDDVVGITGTEEWHTAPPAGGATGGVGATAPRVLCPPGPRSEIVLAPNEHFVPEPPHGPDDRKITVVSGPAGVGKSTYACDQLIRFRSLRPHAPAYLITALETEDESLPTSKTNPKLNLIKLNPAKLVHKPMPLKLLAGSFVIVDDVESMKPEEQKAVRTLVDQIAVRGRCHERGKGGISLLVCMHAPSRGMETRTLLNECDEFVFFPYDPGSYGTMLYALQRYVGLSEAQAQAAMREKSRTLVIRKNSPRLMIAEGRIFVLSRPFADKANMKNFA